MPLGADDDATLLINDRWIAHDATRRTEPQIVLLLFDGAIGLQHMRRTCMTSVLAVGMAQISIYLVVAQVRDTTIAILVLFVVLANVLFVVPFVVLAKQNIAS